MDIENQGAEQQIEQQAPDLRSQLTEAYEEVASSPEETNAEAAQRARDEAGRFAKVEKPAEKQATEQPTRQPIKIRDRDVEWWNRPSTWKKDVEPHWETIPDELKQYLHTREDDFAHGVSTYKQEWDRAKPVLEAISPYLPTFQQYGIQPEQQIRVLLNANHQLAFGTPEQKLGMIQQIIRDYQIPIESLFAQGEDGKMQMRQPPAPQGPTPEQIQQMIDQRVSQQVSQYAQTTTMQEQIKSFENAKGEGGHLLYPHFKEVRDTMAGLLQAGLSDDLPGAYEAALRHPRHAQLFEAMQQEAQAKREAQERTEREAKVKRAKAANVSVTSQTPGQVNGKTPQGLRASLLDAFEQHEHGRV